MLHSLTERLESLPWDIAEAVHIQIYLKVVWSLQGNVKKTEYKISLALIFCASYGNSGLHRCTGESLYDLLMVKPNLIHKSVTLANTNLQVPGHIDVTH